MLSRTSYYINITEILIYIFLMNRRNKLGEGGSSIYQNFSFVDATTNKKF